jgi:RNA recognition motif-containing protein
MHGTSMAHHGTGTDDATTTTTSSKLMADAPLAPVNNACKFFVANINFQTTAPQVKQFFSAFGNVNHVKLIPHTSSSSNNDDNDGGRQRHKGYGFLFMLDEPSTLAVERYANAFPENKIEMLGRRGVFVK